MEQFIARCNEIHGQEWRIVRKGAQRLSRASAVLHAIDPVTYPAADSWAHTQRSRDAAISVSEEDFIQFYPYLPHYIDIGISISIMSGIRLQPGAPRHFGGSNRTIIKQAYEMLVSNRTNLAECPIGALVTLDRVYELVEGNLSNERRTDIHEISERFKGDPDKQWTLRVAKAICLLELVRDLPRTEANIAAFLIDKVGDPAPVPQVEAAIKKLYAAQFVRNTEDGWKLQTAQEKNWETDEESPRAQTP